MVRAVEGTYRNGRVELDQPGPDVGASRVLVVFLPEREDHPEDHQAAVDRMVAGMNRGFDIGAPYPTRDELHERR